MIAAGAAHRIAAIQQDAEAVVGEGVADQRLDAGRRIALFRRNAADAEVTNLKPGWSKGSGNWIFTVAPIAPEDRVASGVFITSTRLTKSAPMALKSKARPTPDAIWRLENSVSLNDGPKPRTVIWVAVPMEVGTPPRLETPRLMVTPGMRCIAAARSRSGNLPISSDEIASTRPPALRLMFRLARSEADQPRHHDLLRGGRRRDRGAPAAVAGDGCARGAGRISRRIIAAPAAVCSTIRSVPASSAFRASAALSCHAAACRHSPTPGPR